MAIPNKISFSNPSFKKFVAIECGLIIFIKNPEPGKVKTRLAKDVGDKNALAIYRRLLEHTRKITSGLETNRLLFYHQQLMLQDEWPEKLYYKFVQQGNDLGERMFNAFKKAFSLKNKHVIIIGSDCIMLTEEIILNTFEQLKTHDFVLGPAKDGGYYLLGMNEPEPLLFQNKNWSTNTVAQHTLADIKRLNKSCYLLPQLSDIDMVDDLTEELKLLIS